MKNITSANTEIYQMLEFCDKGFKDSIMTVLHKTIIKKTNKITKYQQRNNRYERKWKLQN